MSYIDNIKTSVIGETLATAASTVSDLTAAVQTGVANTLANGIATLGVPSFVSGAIGGAVGRITAGVLDEQIGKGLTSLINEVGGPDALLSRTEQLIVGEASGLITNNLNKVVRGVADTASSIVSGGLGSNFSLNSLNNPVEAAMKEATGNIANIVKVANAKMAGIQQASLGISGALTTQGLPTKTVGDLVSGIGDAKNIAGSFGKSVNTFKDSTSSLAGKMPKVAERSVNEITDIKISVTSGSEGIIMYPSTLPQNQDSVFMVLEIDKYTRPEFKTKLDPLYKIVLPLPENLMESFSVKYDPAEIGEYGHILENPSTERVANSFRQGIQGGKNPMDILKDAVDAAGGPTQTGIDIMSGVGGVVTRKSYGALQGLAPDVTGILESMAGVIPNPHPSIFFKGMNLRTHTLQWKFAPRSNQDSLILKSVIKKMKLNFLPKKDSSNILGLLEYPNIVRPVILNNAVKDFLFEFKRCFVSGMNFSYTPDGSSAFYHNGSPVATMVTLELQEIELMTGDEFDRGPGITIPENFYV